MAKRERQPVSATASEKKRQMVESMARYGLRITEQRKSLAGLFAQATGYLTPREVYNEMTASHVGLSFDTVYRNLRTLLDLGILEQNYFEDGHKFRASCFHESNRHHHHLICLSCDHVYPFDFCPMERTESLPETFVVVGHRFDIFGYCLQCSPDGKTPDMVNQVKTRINKA